MFVKGMGKDNLGTVNFFCGIAVAAVMPLGVNTRQEQCQDAPGLPPVRIGLTVVILIVKKCA